MGKNLTFHLTSAVLGIYDRVIYRAGGIPQSAMCDEFLNKNGDGGGFWFEAVPIYPALASLALPAFGSFHRQMMRNYPHIGASIVLVKEIDSCGRVTVNDYGPLQHAPTRNMPDGRRSEAFRGRFSLSGA